MKEKIYEELGSNYRLFLGWRHAAFAGELVILYGVFSLTSQVYKDWHQLAFLVPLIASPIGILLWIIDVRNRDLYHAAIRAGKELEGKDKGFFTELNDNVTVPVNRFSLKTHSAALSILFSSYSGILVIAAIMLFIFER